MVHSIAAPMELVQATDNEWYSVQCIRVRRVQMPLSQQAHLLYTLPLHKPQTLILRIIMRTYFSEDHILFLCIEYEEDEMA